MSRPSAASQRTLTLTEELEKLEQSITLTLQEIDHNFSRAHRIVTTSILPIVSQYATHSKTVWEGSKFWKQFFEASANVSLSGYEELAASEQGEEEDMTEETSTAYDTTITTERDGDGDGEGEGDTTVGADARHRSRRSQTMQSSSMLSSPSLTSSTPRAGARVPGGRPAFAPYPSPYEALKQEMSPSSADASGQLDPAGPSTPLAKLPSMNMTPSSSPFSAAPGAASTTRHGAPTNPDPLLHRVLDKNYRLAATPHAVRTTSKRSPVRTGPRHVPRPASAAIDSPFSSPVAPAPQLHAEIFSSPATRGVIINGTGAGAGARTPGVSVLHITPRHRRPSASHGGGGGGARQRMAWDSDDNEDDDEDDDDSGLPPGMSPPKTMQFAVPQSRLLRTPAREASRKIVSDLLHTAGARDEDEDEDSDGFDFEIDVNAPSPKDGESGGGDDDDDNDTSSPAIMVGKGKGRGGEGGRGGVDDTF